MRMPAKYKVSWLMDREAFGNSLTQLKDGRWVPARPIYFGPMLDRVRLAWGVFVGRYDAIDWEQQ